MIGESLEVAVSTSNKSVSGVCYVTMTRTNILPRFSPTSYHGYVGLEGCSARKQRAREREKEEEKGVNCGLCPRTCDRASFHRPSVCNHINLS